MIPPPRTRHVLRLAAAGAVAFGGWLIVDQCSAAMRGDLGRFPSDDATAGAALALFGFTVASIGLRWSLRARRDGERAAWPLFIDAATTFAALPALAAFAWTMLSRS